jgi:hypothetical protein
VFYHVRRPSVDFLEFTISAAISAAISADIAVTADPALAGPTVPTSETPRTPRTREIAGN